MRALRGVLRVAISTVSLFWAGLSSAQVAVEWQATAGSTLGVTDNVATTPEVADDAPEGTPRPEADGFGTLSPAFEITLETVRATQSIGFAIGYTFYFLHPEANVLSASLGYGLRAPLSDRVELTMGMSGSQTNLATFNLVSAAGATPITPNEGGNNLLITAAVTQGLSVELSETLGLSQGFGAQVGHTIVDLADDQQTFIFSFQLGLNKAFLFDTVGGDFGTEVQLTPEITQANGDSLPLRSEVLHRLGINWQHQYSDDWSTTLGAGVAVGYDAVAPQAPLVHPSGSAAVAYSSDYGTATLSYAHAVQPNILLRQLTLNDSVTLQGLVFLGSSGLDLGASAGYQASRSFLGGGDGFGPVGGHTILADAGLGWVPSADSVVRLEARYQFIRQFAGEPDDAGQQLVPALLRNTGLLSATFGFPNTPQAGGAAAFVVIPAPTANPDIMAGQAPRSERGSDESQRRDEKEKKEDRERRGGSGSGASGE